MLSHVSPIIIHISGSPGSGKTTLGNWILSYDNINNRIAVKDTDDFIQRGDSEDCHLQKYIGNDKEYQRELWSLKTRKIEQFISENADKEIIVFTGLMDHFGLKDFYDFKQATHKYFIDIDSRDLLKQYYSRLAEFGTNDPQFWENIINENDYIMSSREKIQDNLTLSKQHVNHGYELMSSENIKLLFIHKKNLS